MAFARGSGFLGASGAGGGLDLTSGGTIGGNVTLNGNLTMGSGNVILIDPGTAAAPGLAFVGDTNTGLYRVGADNLGLSTGGVLAIDWNTSRALSALVVAIPDGTVGAPGLTFGADLDSGLYRIGANNVAIATNGALALDASASRVLASLALQAGLGIGGTRATQDLVAATQIVPDTIYKNISSTGGNITLTGTPTITAGIDGQVLVVHHAGAANSIIFQDKTAIASGLSLGASASKTLTTGDTFILAYRASDTEWQQVSAVNNNAADA